MKQAIVYRVYDAEGAALYVGMSSELCTRVKKHRRTASWLDAIARVELDGPYPRPIAAAVERAYIRKLQPRHNVYQLRESPKVAVVSVRIEDAKFERFREIAELRGRTWAEELRVLIRQCTDEFRVAA